MNDAPTPETLLIRPASLADWPGIWTVIEPMIREGETHPLDTDLGEEAARAFWFAPDKSVFVAVDAHGDIVGSYGLRANSTGPAAHVANAGYAVRPDQRGKGVAQALCRHSFDQARRRDFRAMQYNLVVSTNARAVRLWQYMGMAVIGRLPGAFRRPNGDYVDALVMHRSLMED